MNDLIIYQNGELELNVSVENDTVWLNRNQISELFDRDVKTIGKHINNVFKDGELAKTSVVANFATTATDGKTYKVDHYNLDVIISVGYRVKSQNGVHFRQWATKVLKEYIFNGYAINSEKITQQRLLNLENEVKVIKSHIKDNTQYKNLQVSQAKNFHDRFLIIDNNEIYHIGASLKDLGKKVFAFSKIDMSIEDILKRIK